MGNMTLSIPKELQFEMKRFSDIRWSEVARKAIAARVETLKIAEKLAEKSQLKGKDIEKFNDKVKNQAGRNFPDENNN